MPHIFISYSKKDTRQLAFALNEALNAQAGLTAWVDTSLQVGASWELQIQEQIDRCDTMVVLLSPDINRHKQGEEPSYVLTEIGYAKRTAKKPILPVMAQPTDLPLALTDVQYLEYATLDGLVTEILAYIGLSAPPQRTSTSKKKKTGPAQMTIEDVFSIAGRGVVVTGQIASGTFRVGDHVTVENDKVVLDCTITGIEMFQQTVTEASAGDNVGLALEGANREHFERGMVVTQE